MISKEFAEQFAEEWIRAWNSHDLDFVLSHYDDDFEMSSPMIIAIAGEPSGTLKGKSAIRAYWQKALEMLPELHFELHSLLLGTDSITLYYRGVSGIAAEVFFFGADGKVVKAHAHYA